MLNWTPFTYLELSTVLDEHFDLYRFKSSSLHAIIYLYFNDCLIRSDIHQCVYSS